MKALVLSGGKGTRLRPLTFTTAKQLIPVANKPILGYVMDQILWANIRDFGIIIAPETGRYVKDYINSLGMAINVIYIQQEPLGLAHAVKTAKHFLGEDSFVMYLGDNLIGENKDNILDQSKIKRLINKFKIEKLDGLILLKEVENPEVFGVAELDDKGNILSLVEKPKQPRSNLALVGLYIFSHNIHKAIDRIKPSWRNELEITDSIQELLNMGYKVKGEILDSWWLDTGKKDDILTANQIILDEFITLDLKGTIDDKSKIIGRVNTDYGSKIRNTMIRGPVIIGKDSIIEDSFVGPYTSIGNNVKVISSSIEHCIILDNSQIQNIERLEDGLIGKDAKISQSKRNNRHKALRLMVGDYSEVDI